MCHNVKTVKIRQLLKKVSKKSNLYENCQKIRKSIRRTMSNWKKFVKNRSEMSEICINVKETSDLLEMRQDQIKNHVQLSKIRNISKLSKISQRV